MRFLFLAILSISQSAHGFVTQLPVGAGFQTATAQSTTSIRNLWHPQRLVPRSPTKKSQVVSLKESLATSATTLEKIETRIDWSALAKYTVAITTQMGLLTILFRGLDTLVERYSLQVPFALNFVLFYFLSLKSRIFNPLSNQRPNSTQNLQESQQRKLPSWTPPGVVFPIMWLLIIGPIRSIASCMVYQSSLSSRTYACLPILSFVLHLSIGDVWNTINNVERRFGASVTGVVAVWLSKAHAAYQYGLVNLAAGQLLAVPLVWLTVATALIGRTWRINPVDVGRCDSLVPIVERGEKSVTKFAWFSRSSSSS